MSLIIVGGHDRMHKDYKHVCRSLGHKVKIFTQLPAKFEKQIGNPDRIILLTSTVSHKMVKIAVKEAKKKDITLIRSHSSSLSSLKTTIDELSDK